MKSEFGFKELKVWQKSMDFADAVLEVAENISSERKHFRLIEQIESSSTSVPQNIAEGKGRNSQKEFIQFLYIARGSLYETVTLLNIFYRRKWITEETLLSLENQAYEIASMLKGLINSLYKDISNKEKK
ncbi:MAG: four helix bundle protein [Bacteroidetes bacterium]|nr:MAG: four helix bundle protein [Bacteroidota bacterium]